MIFTSAIVRPIPVYKRISYWAVSSQFTACSFKTWTLDHPVSRPNSTLWACWSTLFCTFLATKSFCCEDCCLYQRWRLRQHPFVRCRSSHFIIKCTCKRWLRPPRKCMRKPLRLAWSHRFLVWVFLFSKLQKFARPWKRPMILKGWHDSCGPCLYIIAAIPKPWRYGKTSRF